MEKSLINGGFNGEIIYKWAIYTMAMLNNQRAIANGPTELGTLGASTIHCTCYYMFIMFEYVWAIPIQETNVEPTIENQQESNQRNLLCS